MPSSWWRASWVAHSTCARVRSRCATGARTRWPPASRSRCAPSSRRCARSGCPWVFTRGALPAAGAFGATLWLEDGPVDCEVRGVLDAGVLALRLERFASTLPREGLAASCGAALRPLEWTLAARGTPLHVSVDEHEQRLTLTIDHALEALLAGGLLAAGWRVPRTRGLAGLPAVVRRGRAPRDHAHAAGAGSAPRRRGTQRRARGRANGGRWLGRCSSPRAGSAPPGRGAGPGALRADRRRGAPSGSSTPTRRSTRRRSCEPTPRSRSPSCSASASWRGDVTDVDTDITQLALRALGSAGRSPNVAARVLGARAALACGLA
jgi:hypothetical protein